jgi:ubiquinone/menaquinone biosynthesis C-methylase UbiE
MNFEDHFSRQAQTYAQFRPRYPRELFAYLSEQTPEHHLAWDCATGSGQAAQGLVTYYDRVIATDASAAQINNAQPHERITYLVEPAEETSLAPHSVDLVTVAVAVHWFDFERFYQEVRRVVKPGGVIAVWTYHRPQITPEIDSQIAALEDQILGEYWPERIHYLREHYQTLPFPFVEMNSPEFSIEADWNLDQLLGFINTWSAVRRYEEQRGVHPFQMIWEDLLAAWGDPGQARQIRWELYLRMGRV